MTNFICTCGHGPHHYHLPGPKACYYIDCACQGFEAAIGAEYEQYLADNHMLTGPLDLAPEATKPRQMGRSMAMAKATAYKAGLPWPAPEAQPASGELEEYLSDMFRMVWRDASVGLGADRTVVCNGATRMSMDKVVALLETARTEARREELEALVNKPGATHDDIYYAAVARLAELEGK